VHAGQDVAKTWSAGYFEAIRRRKAGEAPRLPLRKRYLVPITFRTGEFVLGPATERGRLKIWLRTRLAAVAKECRPGPGGRGGQPAAHPGSERPGGAPRG
jgi:hypothetical protein